MIVKLSELGKRYAHGHALQNISLALEENKIYGVLGRNGAGKSTLLKLIAGHIQPSLGTVSVFGHNPMEDSSVQRQLCLVAEGQRFLANLTVRGFLDVAGAMYAGWDSEYAHTICHSFHINIGKTFRELSQGQRSAVRLVVGLASRSPLTMFDEPFLALDPAGRCMFYDLLLEDFTAYPRTILLSTHLADEVVRLLDKVVILDRGKLAVFDDIDTALAMALVVTGPQEAVAAVSGGKKVLSCQKIGPMVRMILYDCLSPSEEEEVRQLGLAVGRLSIQQLMVYLTQREKNGGWHRE